MRKKVLSLLLSTMLVAAATGCAGTSPESSGDSSDSGNAANQETSEDASGTESSQAADAGSGSEETPATYEEMIESLHAGQSYTYAPIYEGEEALLVTSYTFNDMEGHQGTYEAAVYVEGADGVKKVTTVQSGGTAYPLAVSKDNTLVACMRNSIQEGYVDKASGEYVITRESNIDYRKAEDGDYHNYIKDSADVPEGSDLYDELDDEYYASEILSFTSAGLNEDGTPKLAGAVYSAYGDDNLYSIISYIAFDSDVSGHVQTPDGVSGVAFDYEVNGDEITFHFGSADDNTKAKFNYDNSSFPTLAFDADDNILGAKVVTITCLGGADAATFDAITYYENDTNLYMQVTSCDETSLTGDLYRQERIKKDYVEGAEEGSILYSENGTPFEAVSFEDANKDIQYGTDELFKEDVVGSEESLRFSDYVLKSSDDNSYYALAKEDYDELYSVVPLFTEGNIMKLIEQNVTFKIKENCEMIILKFVESGEPSGIVEEYLVGREFQGSNYPGWSEGATEYYLNSSMLMSIGVIDDELYAAVQVYVP
ncbi:hypothetical protein [Butyrivibrio proteoclasticus]|uniref:hypothetical protein n=1 Tax=Butyrivibrio proteoclasticus TaxID=43305 RepID=UPI00047C799B|nr:hypothetical protein [Butyrivibrio proteoclasticus]